MSDTVLDDDYGALADFAQAQEKTMIQNLILEEQGDSQTPEDPQQAEMIEKYKEYLTFKVYGKGAFGEVTEFYDIINRERVAKKVFTNITNYKVEKDVMTRIDEALGKQLSEDIILGVSKYDAKNQTIYYRAGNCNLADLCNKRREQNIYWFNNEKELLYVADTLFNYVIKMADKNVYHSDLKPVNTCLVFNDKGIEQYDLKLIDMGGATFHWNYLVAITPTYFPESDVFNANENQERRTKAEIYQVGRILQEVCLGSIHAKNHHLYHKSNFRSYKDFIKYYMVNTQEMRDKSLALIKDYYSQKIYELVKKFLDYNETVESSKILMEALKLDANKTFRDAADMVKFIESQKLSQMFESIEISEDKIQQELDFYLQFDFDERGLQRVKDELNRRYKKEYEDGLYSKFPILAIYELIFYTRCQQHNKSSFFEEIQKWDPEQKDQDSSSDSDSEKLDKTKIKFWDRDYDETDTVILPKKKGYWDKTDEARLVFQSPQISDQLKLQFFCEVVGKTAHFDQYLEKETIEKIITLLGFDDENSPYEDVITKYQKFFQKGSSQVYNDTLVKKTAKGLQSLIDEADTEEKKNIFRSFIFQIKCLFVEACYKKMEEAIKKNLDILGNIDQAMDLFKQIKKSEYGKQMQFLQLTKGFYLLKKFEIQNKQSPKPQPEKQKSLQEVKEILQKCSSNMIKVGSSILKYEKELYKQLAILSNELDDKIDCHKYEYLTMQKEHLDIGRNCQYDKLAKLVVGKQWKEYGSLKDHEKKEILTKFYKEEYFNITDQWSGYLLPQKQIFLALRASAYKKSIKWGKFEENTDLQIKTLKGFQYDGRYGPLELFQMNPLQTQVQNLRNPGSHTYNKQVSDDLISWFQNFIQLEKKNEEKMFSKQLTDEEKDHYKEIFTCDFKLDYLKLMIHQQMIKDYKTAYEITDFLKDKYIDSQQKLNDITLMELYIAATQQNPTKFKKSLKDLEKDEFTPSQTHQLSLIQDYKTETKKKSEKFDQFTDPKYYNEWQCPYCEKDLKYFENKNSWDSRHKYLQCNSCSEFLSKPEDGYAFPCYGCECQKEWKNYTRQFTKIAILSDGNMEKVKQEYAYYDSYYICLQCINKKKQNTCPECKTQLKKVTDPYDNYHLIDGQKGFCCKKGSNICSDKRQNKHSCYWCPNPKCTTKKGSDWLLKFKPHENRYTVCIACVNSIPRDQDYRDYLQQNSKEKSQYDKLSKEVESLHKQIKNKAQQRSEIFQQHLKDNLKGYDFQLVYDIFDNKYGEDWKKYYQQEQQYKKNPSSRPNNLQYPAQKQQQQYIQQQKQPAQQLKLEQQQNQPQQKQEEEQQKQTQQQQQQKSQQQQQQKQQQQQQKQQQNQYQKYQRALVNKIKQRDGTACCKIF